MRNLNKKLSSWINYRKVAAIGSIGRYYRQMCRKIGHGQHL
jgi:hypothetical protein